MKNSFYILEKGKLNNLLRALMKDFCLVSPQPADNGDFLFQDTEDVERIDLNYDITSNTLKEFFFPQRETIFRYEIKRSGSVKIIPRFKKIKRKTIFFGLRSCDIKAVNFQDCFFSQEPRDNLYWQKRDKTILISLACNKPPRQSCFCIHTQHSGPVLEKDAGFDLQFIDLTKAYLVEIGTGKGENLIKRYKRFFSTADKNLSDKKTHLKESCLRHFTPLEKIHSFRENSVTGFNKEYDILRIYDKLKVNDMQALWEDLGKRCTNCGGCEFICPTCFCFYTQDSEDSSDKGKRIRAWDSCTFSGYSRLAGDTNPYEKNSQRISRRFFCKLYNGYNWFKLFACTGCGRCSFVCPVNLDMESFIASLMKGNQYQPLLKEL